MEWRDKKYLVCNCFGTMPLDEKGLKKACAGAKGLKLNSELCRSQLENFTSALEAGTEVIVGCTQEAPLFDEVAQEKFPDTPVRYVNIRERAGWSSEAKKAQPKIAALLAEAALEAPPTPGVSMHSAGAAVVYGSGQEALDVAKQLSQRLDVTCVLTSVEDIIPPQLMDLTVCQGTLVAAGGHLGDFEITFKDYAPVDPSSRDELKPAKTPAGGVVECDLIFDVSGGKSMFIAPEKRDGYFNPDPGNPALVQKAIFEAADMVGEFEKPRYVRFDESICVHSRSKKEGCSRCLDICPAGAIRPDGDHVLIDPYICGGCGGCASVCPTGAATYDMPSENFLYTRMKALRQSFAEAGGKNPVLLVHDTRFGEEAVAMLSRFGKGLPANVIPFAVNETTQVGLDFLLSAVAFGFDHVRLLINPKRREETDGLASQVALAETILMGLGYDKNRIGIIDVDDPLGLEDALSGLRKVKAGKAAAYQVMGKKRSTMSLALAHLHDNAPRSVDEVALPEGAPFGTVDVDVDGCTVCLSCVTACPANALQDNPDKPQLKFLEEACVQCGLCENTCPEEVITLKPRINFRDEARNARLIKEEEPFHCVRCGQPFGVKASIDKMVEQLAGHSMFADERALERIKMCMDCRVADQFDAPDTPFSVGPRPRTRTTDDYLSGELDDEDDNGGGTPPSIN